MIQCKFNLIKNESTGTADLYLYGVVTEDHNMWDETDITPSRVQNALMQAGDAPINIYLTTPGGSCSAGSTINAILGRHQGHITLHIDGIVASAGTWLLPVVDKVVVNNTALLMIHEAHSFAWGTAAEMRKQADVMDTINKQMATMYQAMAASRGKEVTQDVFLSAMAEETWYSAEDAVLAGLADEVTKVKEPNQQVPNSKLKNSIEPSNQDALDDNESETIDTIGGNDIECDNDDLELAAAAVQVLLLQSNQ